MEKDSLVSKRLNTDIVADSNNRLKRDVAYRIISDHLWALTICVNDNILPGRENCFKSTPTAAESNKTV